MTGNRVILLIALAAAFAPRPALAAEGSTDYVVTLPTGLYETPPANAATIGISPVYAGVNVGLPFSFPYFGIYYSQIAVTQTGYIQFGVASGTGQAQSASKLSGVTASDGWDGMCAACWDNIYNGNGGTIRSWTAGTAPNRRFIVSWEGFNDLNVPASNLTFQIRLFETSGKIQLAYKADTVPTGWGSRNYVNGVVAPGADPRWTAVTTNIRQTGHPSTDYELTPRLIHFTGSLVYDRPVPTASGIPAATANVPLTGIRIESRFSTGTLNGFGACDANGDFDVAAQPGPAGFNVDLHAVAGAVSCAVASGVASAPYSFPFATGLAFTSDVNIGTKAITAAADPAAAFRGPAAIASAIQRAYAWAKPLTSDAIPPLTVLWSATDPTATNFAGGSSPALRIAGPVAADPDTWDDPVVIRDYARHVLASVAAGTNQPYDGAFDAVSTDENAFAAGFGHYLAAAVLGTQHFIDGLGPSLATDIDLEDPKPSTRKGSDVTAWVAAALYDTLDPANEPHDRIDGSGAASAKAFQAVDALTAAPTATRFFQAWAAQSGAQTLSRDLVAHGVLPDDAYEANDDAGEPASLGAAGVRRDALVLNTNDEDWFAVDLAEAAPALVAEMTFARTTYPAGIQIDVYGPGGALAATKTDLTGLGPISLATGPIGPGTCTVRIRHVQGEIVGAYTFQVARRMELGAASLKSWTIGRPYDDAIPLLGGIRPYAFTITPGGGGIPGVGLSTTSLHATGAPTFVGVYSFTLTVEDAGSPLHAAQSTHRVVINAALDFPLAEFLGVPLGRAADVTLPRIGGTSPFTFSVAAGALPDGLVLDDDALRVHGTATTAGSVKLTIDGADAAGSVHDEEVTAVVCVPLATPATPFDLAAGGAASGFFVDAVKGSSISLGASTVKGRPKRLLRAVALDSGATEIPGAVVKGGNGKASATKVVAPESGRFYFVVASDAGDATQLLGKLVAKAPAKGKGSIDALAANASFDVELGALAGATLSFSAKPDPKSGVTLNVIAVFGPDGAALPTSGLVTHKGPAVALNTPLAKSGTWTIRVRGAGENPTKVAWSFSLRQPKGGTYSAD